VTEATDFWTEFLRGLRDRGLKIAAMLEAAEPDLTAFAPLPREHWQKIWSNNPIERLNREIKRCTDVVQIFPDRESVTRLIGAVLQEQHEEWTYGERRYFSDISIRKLVHIPTSTPNPPAPSSTSPPDHHHPSRSNRSDTTPRDLMSRVK
jgi:putative transposase